MRSRAAFKDHPIHSMLVSYPFALLTGAWAFGLAGALLKKRELRTVSRHLVPAGVATGLLAAVPGIIDYTGSVPPDSSARERATKHALLNTASLLLFSAGWMIGRRPRHTLPSLVVQGLGAAALSLGGWLGGTLVVRNQIGVDHRYASAGKWNEQSLEQSGRRALTSAAVGLDKNQMKLVHRGNERIVVARTEQGYAAFADRCTHKGGPLSDGVLICGIVQCPWHGSQFDVNTGEVKCGPAEKNVRTYDINPAHVPVKTA